jgi:hypothetical protein
MNLPKTADHKQFVAQYRLSARRRRYAVAITLIAIGLGSIAFGAGLFGRPAEKANLSPLSQSEKAGLENPQLQNSDEISRIQKQALRRANNHAPDEPDQRDFYRGALRMLNRLNDVHSRL